MLHNLPHSHKRIVPSFDDAKDTTMLKSMVIKIEALSPATHTEHFAPGQLWRWM